MSILPYTLDELRITDLPAFRQVPLYEPLAAILTRARYPFRVVGTKNNWPLTLLLNLTYWGRDGDLLPERKIPADVVTHAAWHFLANRAFAAKRNRAASADALFMGEAIASAFDVYLVGMLLVRSPGSEFLSTQVPLMSETAASFGLSSRSFKSLLRQMASAPEESFEELRALLFDATFALYRARSSAEAFERLSSFAPHRFYPLLHRYELSNWVLYAKAYGQPGQDPRVTALDRLLRKTPRPVSMLERRWVIPALEAK